MSLKVVYVSFPVLFFLFSTKKDIYYLINIEYIYIAFYDVKLKYLSILLSIYISLSLKENIQFDLKLCFLAPPNWNKISHVWGNCTTFWNLRQSPINIKTLDTVYMPNQKLGFHNLCKRVKGKAINNGKSTNTFYYSLLRAT